MSPATHFFMSWVIAAKTTDNPRDCRLVTLAGILPDLDGLGLIPDVASRALAIGERCTTSITITFYCTAFTVVSRLQCC